MRPTHLGDLTEQLIATLDEGGPTGEIVSAIGDALPDALDELAGTDLTGVVIHPDRCEPELVDVAESEFVA